jgi:hypothetical protein
VRLLLAQPIIRSTEEDRARGNNRPDRLLFTRYLLEKRLRRRRRVRTLIQTSGDLRTTRDHDT